MFYKVIYTDVALDPYSSDGHDGIVREDGKANSDFTVFGFDLKLKCKKICWENVL